MHTETLEKKDTSSYYEINIHLHFMNSDFNPFSD